MRKAQLAGDMADRNSAADLAEVAVGMVPPGSRLSAIARTYSGYGYALLRDPLAAERTYEAARRTLEGAGAERSWGSWFNSAYIDAHRARSLAQLGDYKQAIVGFESAISNLDKRYPRDRGVYIARAALTYAEARELERAAELGLEALSIGAGTGSARIMSHLASLADKLAGVRGPAAEYREAFDQAVLGVNGKGATT